MATEIVLPRRLTVVLILTISVCLCESNECVPRDYGYGSVVCVCNGTHCDKLPPIQRTDPGVYVIYTSSKSGLRFFSSHGNFAEKEPKDTNNLITIDPNNTHQEILGWGGAFTDSTCININSLNEETRANLLSSYFGQDGIEYSLARVPIAGTDFSTKFYTYDDVQNDANLTHFNLTIEDYKYKIPNIQEALKLSKNTLKLIASAWSSPTWMKTNNETAGFGFLKREYYQAWADYHIKFLDAYKENGINIWGITTGNEPINAFLWFLKINVLGWVPWTQGSWIANNLGPTIRNSTYGNTKIIALDDQRSLAPFWLILETLLNNALSYIDGIGTHWYFNNLPSFLWLQHMIYPNKFILGTEASTGGYGYTPKVALGSWVRGENFADDIFENVNEWLTGWLEWNFALDLQGGPTYINNFVDASTIVNETAQEFYKQPMYYVLGHFSKFIPPSSIKISTNVNTNLVKVLGFTRPDNGTAVIVFNKNDQNVTMNLYDPRRGYIHFDVPQRSINSIVYY